MEEERLPLFCYLTNLVYLCCALYYTVAAYNAIMSRTLLCGNNKQAPPVFRMDKVGYDGLDTKVKSRYIAQWLLHSVIINLGFLVTLLYFVLIYDPEVDVLGLSNISRHILNSIFILIELSFNSIAIKFVHLVWSIVFALLYTLYTVIFWFVVAPPENYIYEVVDWNRPARTIRLVLILFTSSVIVKAVLVAVWKCKLRTLGISRSQQMAPFSV